MSRNPVDWPDSRIEMAYELGRLLGRFRFEAAHVHLALDYQKWEGEDRFRIAQESLEDLKVGARRLRNVTDRPRFENEFERVCGRFMEQYLAFEYSATHWSLLKESLDDNIHRHSIREIIEDELTWVERKYQELRRLISDGQMSDNKALAFELGEVVESGLRPKWIWEYCVEVLSPGPSVIDPDAEPANLLPVPVTAGTVPLDDRWFKDLNKITAELLDHSFADEFCASEFFKGCPTPTSTMSSVGLIDSKIKSALAVIRCAENLPGISRETMRTEARQHLDSTGFPINENQPSKSEGSLTDSPVVSETDDRNQQVEGTPINEKSPIDPVRLQDSIPTGNQLIPVQDPEEAVPSGYSNNARRGYLELELDESRMILRRANKREVELVGEVSFQLLRYLISKEDNLSSVSELRDKVWDEKRQCTVEDSTITDCISRVNKLMSIPGI